jgi:predicted HTH transcriptional regulator
MKIKKIKEVPLLGESQNIEFKSRCPDSTLVGPIVCGLLNTSAGGFIVCGTNEVEKIIGIDNVDATVKTLG